MTFYFINGSTGLVVDFYEVIYQNENIHICRGIVVFIDVFGKTTTIVQIVKICHRYTDEKNLKRFSQKNKLRLFASV